MFIVKRKNNNLIKKIEVCQTCHLTDQVSALKMKEEESEGNLIYDEIQEKGTPNCKTAVKINSNLAYNAFNS